MEQRRLAGTEHDLSVIGFGGMVVNGESQIDSNRYVGMAIDRGINYFDVAPTYGDAEQRLGPALRPYRARVFLACKTLERFRAGAAKSLDQSLRKLQTSYLDLYQFHAVNDMDEVRTILDEDGALVAARAAKQQGKIRYIGFSSHSEECATALLQASDFDTVLFPWNWACWYKSGFGQGTLKSAVAEGKGILALKALAKRRWQPGEARTWPKCWYRPVDREEADLALRFTLSLPITAAVSPSHAELLWWAVEAAERYLPLTESEREILEQKSQDLEVIFPGEVPL